MNRRLARFRHGFPEPREMRLVRGIERDRDMAVREAGLCHQFGFAGQRVGRIVQRQVDDVCDAQLPQPRGILGRQASRGRQPAIDALPAVDVMGILAHRPPSGLRACKHLLALGLPA